MQRFLTQLFVVLLLFAGHFAHAQTADAWENFTGKWLPDANAAQAVADGVDRSLKSMNAVTRAIARRQLIAGFAPTWVRMERQNEFFTIEFADKPPRQMPISGAGIVLDKQTFSLQLEDEGKALRQTAVRSDGTRVNLFRVGKDGSTLTMEATITSPRLTVPVQFTIEFSRAKEP
jgi:hypothetical protein